MRNSFLNKILCKKPCSKSNYLPKSINLPPIGQQGPKGATEATGPTGPVGPTGPSGENLIIRSTSTLQPGEQATVKSFHDGNTTFLDFGIPKGYDGQNGVPEKIIVGKTTQVESNVPASVTDNYKDGVHYFEFHIPKGEIGPKGEKGEQGVAGPPGSTNNINVTLFNPNNQDISNSRPLTFGQTLTNNGITTNETSVFIPANGTYVISFSMNNGSSAAAGDCVGVYKNSSLIPGTTRPLTSSTNVSAMFVVSLKINDIITLVPKLSTNRTITASGAPSIMLSVVQIAT